MGNWERYALWVLVLALALSCCAVAFAYMRLHRRLTDLEHETGLRTLPEHTARAMSEFFSRPEQRALILSDLRAAAGQV